MANEIEPRIDQWYARLDKGQRFYITAIDKMDDTIEVQHFDGDVEEFTLEEWRELDIELSEAPESWSGALDVVEQDDFGTEITDTQPEDWNEPEQDFQPARQEKLTEDLELTEEVAQVGLTTGEKMVGEGLVKRSDGKYEERLSDIWVAEYTEEAATGLWRVEVLKHDVSEWRASDFASIEEARQSAAEYYNQV